MFSRPLWLTEHDFAQHDILTRIAELADAGVIETTRTLTFDFSELPQAQDRQAAGRLIGKQVATVKF